MKSEIDSVSVLLKLLFLMYADPTRAHLVEDRLAQYVLPPSILLPATFLCPSASVTCSA